MLHIRLHKSVILKIGCLIFLMVMIISPKSVGAMTVTVGIPETYSEVIAGEKVYFETEVKWPENIGRKDLRIEYSVFNKDGGEVAYLKVLKAIETQASFMDSIPIPESVSPGLYKVVVKVSDYKNLTQEVAASFNVVRAGNNIQTYLFIIIGLLSFLSVFVIVQVVVITKRQNI